VPNDRYWDTKPRIDKVTFQFITETGPALQAVKTGEADAAYPTPDVGILDEFDEERDLEYTTSLGNTYEAIWFNTTKPPLDRVAVRQALAHATDRQALVDQLLVPSVRAGEVLQSFNVPTYAAFYEPSFARYTRDVGRVEALMTGDGWQRNGDGVWEKDGQPASIELNTTDGVAGRELAVRLLQSQWEDAGFEVDINNSDPATLFGEWLPQGILVAGVFSSVGSPDPGLCILFCSSAIPSEANDNSGLNITYLSSPAIDAPLTAQDQELDVAARATLVKQGAAALADEVPAIPLYQAPTVFVWNAGRIGGPLADNTTSGPFFNLNEWTVR
jgi:peptide/nickel transport system substrate-binding protein